MAIFAEVSENEFVRESHHLSKARNLINTARHPANGARQDVSQYYSLIESLSIGAEVNDLE